MAKTRRIKRGIRRNTRRTRRTYNNYNGVGVGI